MSLLSRTHDLVGLERGSCSTHYNSNATFREESLGSKQDMADREAVTGGMHLEGALGEEPPV